MAAPDRKAPTTEQRRKALDLAVTLAAAHKDLRLPGDAALLWAENFADYLANGAQPEPAENQ